MSSSSAVTRLTRTPAGRSTLNSVTVGPATQPTTFAMMLKSSSVSCRHAPVSCSSASVARSFSGLVDVASKSMGGSSKPCSGRGVATGVGGFDEGRGAGATPRSTGLRRPSLRVKVCGSASAARFDCSSVKGRDAATVRAERLPFGLSSWSSTCVGADSSSGFAAPTLRMRSAGRLTRAKGGAATTPFSASAASLRSSA